MIEIVTKAYTFEELGEQEQQVALDNNRDYNVSRDQWYEFVEEGFVRDLQDKGFLNIEIAFSGFWRQGDGASFTADIDIHKMNEYYKLGLKKSVCDIINEYCCPRVRRGTSRYSHEHTCSIDWDGFGHYNHCPRLEKLIENTMNTIEGIRLDLSKELYSNLEGEYNHLTSDAVIKKVLVENDYLFTINGKNHPFA